MFTRPWKTLDRQEVPDLCQAVFSLVKESPRAIHIGTDSKKFGQWTDFVTAVVVLKPGRGGRAFYARQREKYISSLQHKLFTEVSLSLEVALALCNAGLDASTIDVHVDANTNLRQGSGPFHQQLAGMVAGYGFRSVLKPSAWAASYVADHAVRGKNANLKPHQRRRKMREEAKGKTIDFA